MRAGIGSPINAGSPTADVEHGGEEDRGSGGLARPLREFGETVAEASDLTDVRDEILQALATLSEQAADSPEKRRGIVIQTMMGVIEGLVQREPAMAQSWEALKARIKEFFGSP